MGRCMRKWRVRRLANRLCIRLDFQASQSSQTSQTSGSITADGLARVIFSDFKGQEEEEEEQGGAARAQWVGCANLISVVHRPSSSHRRIVGGLYKDRFVAAETGGHHHPRPPRTTHGPPTTTTEGKKAWFAFSCVQPIYVVYVAHNVHGVAERLTRRIDLSPPSSWLVGRAGRRSAAQISDRLASSIRIFSAMVGRGP